jgi:hypothetical protein
MTSTLGRVVNFPGRSTASRAGAAVSRAAADLNASVTRLTDEQAGMVDDWGRDPGLVRTMISASRLRWDVAVGGDQRLPRRKGALIVVSARARALAPVFSALALSQVVDRPVRFEIGAPSRSPRQRRGPLSELELADQVGRDIESLLAEMGEIRTGTPLDWLPLSGLGGA